MMEYTIKLPFKIGDVVQLNSGGPEMTVTNITVTDASKNLGTITCQYFKLSRTFSNTGQNAVETETLTTSTATNFNCFRLVERN